jgi:hypothetical protein
MDSGTKLFYPACGSAGKLIFVRQLLGPHLSTCPWGRRRSSMALTAAASASILPQSSTGRFNAESVFMRTPRSTHVADRHLPVFSLRIIGAALSSSMSLSVALKRPVRSFGAITDSKASSFTLGSARV